MHYQIFEPNEFDLSFQASSEGAKFHKNRLKMATINRDSETDGVDRSYKVSLACYDEKA